MIDLAGSPSQGEYEALRALRRARGHEGNHVPAWRLKRYLPFRTPLADIAAVLDAQTPVNVDKDGDGNYCLTAAGAAVSRAHRPRHYPIWVV